jgi:hypothetical protein
MLHHGAQTSFTMMLLLFAALISVLLQSTKAENATADSLSLYIFVPFTDK